MNRRSLFRRILGLGVAALAAKALPVATTAAGTWRDRFGPTHFVGINGRPVAYTDPGSPWLSREEAIAACEPSPLLRDLSMIEHTGPYRTVIRTSLPHFH